MIKKVPAIWEQSTNVAVIIAGFLKPDEVENVMKVCRSLRGVLGLNRTWWDCFDRAEFSLRYLPPALSPPSYKHS